MNLGRLLAVSASIALSSLIAAMAVAATTPNPPPQVCVNGKCQTSAQANPSSGQMKWHPGHYMLSAETDRSSSDQVQSKRNEQALVVSASNVVGWAGNYTWDILNPADGTFDFSHIDADIAALGGKRIIIGIEGIYSPSNHIPSWILSNSSYGPSPSGGQHGYWTGYGGTEYVPAWWRPAVMQKWIALIQALAARYDGNPLVEAIIHHDEDAFNIDGGSDYSVTSFYTQRVAEVTAAVAALPHTSFVLQQNFVQSGSIQDSATILQASYVGGAAFGGPDIRGYSADNSDPSDIWSIGVYMGQGGTTPGLDYRGKMPCIHDIQSPELTGGSFGPWTPQDIFKEADTNMQCSHLLWNFVGGTGTGNWSGGSNSVISTINSSPVSHTACPTAYSAKGCKTS